MRKIVLSLFVSMTFATSMFAANAEKIIEVENHVLKKSAAFACAGEIYIIDAQGNKIKTLLFSAPQAANHLDCLQRFNAEVQKVDATLKAGEKTTGTVSYI